MDRQIAPVEVAGSVIMVIFEEIVKICVFNLILLFYTQLYMCTLLRELCLCELMSCFVDLRICTSTHNEKYMLEICCKYTRAMLYISTLSLTHCI